MNELLHRTVMITGASSGIGEALARQLSRTAKTLVLVARRSDRLSELKRELETERAELRVVIEPCDLADRQAMDQMLGHVAREVGPVDLLINNAGFGDSQFFEASEWEKLHEMVNVNIVALMYMSRKVVESMIARKSGAIVNVGSVLSFSFLPGMACYTGTKFFVSGFSESLRAELAGTGVTVSQVCPGPVTTEFFMRAGRKIRYGEPPLFTISSEQCARDIVKGIARGKPRIIPGRAIYLLGLLLLVLPWPILRLVHGAYAKRLRRKFYVSCSDPNRPVSSA